MSEVAGGRRACRPAAIAVGSAVAVGVALLAGMVGDDRTATETRTGDGDGSAVLQDDAAPFTITGDAAGTISLGGMAPLDLELTNSNDVAVSVTHLSVTVREVTAPEADAAHPCVVGDFVVHQMAAGVGITVAGRATSSLADLGIARTAWPRVGLLGRSVNQDGCKGASVTLEYAASGTTDR